MRQFPGFTLNFYQIGQKQPEFEILKNIFIRYEILDTKIRLSALEITGIEIRIIFGQELLPIIHIVSFGHHDVMSENGRNLLSKNIWFYRDLVTFPRVNFFTMTVINSLATSDLKL